MAKSGKNFCLSQTSGIASLCKAQTVPLRTARADERLTGLFLIKTSVNTADLRRISTPPPALIIGTASYYFTVQGRLAAALA